MTVFSASSLCVSVSKSDVCFAFFFFFQAEDGIRDRDVTGVQTCALPICPVGGWVSDRVGGSIVTQIISAVMAVASLAVGYVMMLAYESATPEQYFLPFKIGRASCRERV